MSTKLLNESNKTPLAVAEDGSIPVVLITPGKGSSGYYTEEMIKQYCAEAWPAGTHSYINHLKPGEIRDPEKLLGHLTEDAHWDDEKQAAVSRLMPRKSRREFVEEVAPLLGLSISAQGTGKLGEIDGEDTYIVESLLPDIQNTVDLVSYAGRGGYIESLLESAIHGNPSETSAGNGKEGNENMALEEKVEALTSTVAELVSLITAKEAAAAAAVAEADTKTADAAKAVDATRAVEAAQVPEAVKATLIEGIKNGDYEVKARLDEAVALRESVKAEVLAEQAALGMTASGSNKDLSESTSVKGW